MTQTYLQKRWFCFVLFLRYLNFFTSEEGSYFDHLGSLLVTGPRIEFWGVDSKARALSSATLKQRPPSHETAVKAGGGEQSETHLETLTPSVWVL